LVSGARAPQPFLKRGIVQASIWMVGLLASIAAALVDGARNRHLWAEVLAGV
jgi:hypothetical protein